MKIRKKVERLLQNEELHCQLLKLKNTAELSKNEMLLKTFFHPTSQISAYQSIKFRGRQVPAGI